MKTTSDGPLERKRLRIDMEFIGDGATTVLADVNLIDKSDKKNEDYRFTALARCHPDDRYDLAVGARVALLRALERLTQELGEELPEGLLAHEPEPSAEYIRGVADGATGEYMRGYADGAASRQARKASISTPATEFNLHQGGRLGS